MSKKKPDLAARVRDAMASEMGKAVADQVSQDGTTFSGTTFTATGVKLEIGGVKVKPHLGASEDPLDALDTGPGLQRDKLRHEVARLEKALRDRDARLRQRIQEVDDLRDALQDLRQTLAMWKRAAENARLELAKARASARVDIPFRDLLKLTYPDAHRGTKRAELAAEMTKWLLAKRPKKKVHQELEP